MGLIARSQGQAVRRGLGKHERPPKLKLRRFLLFSSSWVCSIHNNQTHASEDGRMKVGGAKLLSCKGWFVQFASSTAQYDGSKGMQAESRT